jgi:alkanesulfonate monooxygenase SsuD/methylene tetrahydromethanopterin reductase-like flavin-dependent oxidoreductase (luciferase family)
MTPIKFGVGFATNIPAPQVIRTAQLAERLGFDVFWVTDSHLAGREAMAMLGALAVSTSTIHLGPGVSHLAGRHPSVIASAMATLAELAPGRIRLGIGVGDTGPLNLGVPRTNLRELEAAVIAIRNLIEGRAVEGASKTLELAFGSSEHHIPIYVAGSGERTQRMAGRVADGALLSGMPDRFPASAQLVRAGEQEAGRPHGQTRLLFWTTVAVDENREAARAAVRASVAKRAMNSYAGLAREGKLDPIDLQAINRLQTEHDRADLWESGYVDLVPEPWIDRFTVAGTPQEVRGRLERAVQQGADEISMILMGPQSRDRGSAEQLTRFAETVMQPMRHALQATA